MLLLVSLRAGGERNHVQPHTTALGVDVERVAVGDLLLARGLRRVELGVEAGAPSLAADPKHAHQLRVLAHLNEAGIVQFDPEMCTGPELASHQPLTFSTMTSPPGPSLHGPVR